MSTRLLRRVFRKRSLPVFLAMVLALTFGALGLADSPNGSAGDMPAYYDGNLFTINFKELPAGGEAAVLQQNGQINIIYMSDQAVALGFDFISVLDAIQGDGFNPLWQEVQITFLTIPPQQFFSDNEVLAAFAAGEIDLTMTDEVYRCAVVGPKK
jgi:hypothetical protein